MHDNISKIIFNLKMQLLNSSLQNLLLYFVYLFVNLFNFKISLVQICSKTYFGGKVTFELCISMRKDLVEFIIFNMHSIWNIESLAKYPIIKYDGFGCNNMAKLTIY